MEKNNFWDDFTLDDVKRLLRPQAQPESRFKFVLFLVGVFLTPITLAGAMLGYWRAYQEYLKPRGIPPIYTTAFPIVIISMVMYAILTWVFLFVVFVFYVNLVNFMFDSPYDAPYRAGLTIYLIVASIISVVMIVLMDRWRNQAHQGHTAASRYGTARWMTDEERDKFSQHEGISIGIGHNYKEQGHFLTVAGTRGGKGVNLIIPNLLGESIYNGSWVVIDPKGENHAITQRWQRHAGREVITLSPWSPSANRYNPLDILNPDDPDMCDDAMMLAEMIVPVNPAKEDDFFKSRARSLIAGIMMHHVLTYQGDEGDEPALKPTLHNLWAALRRNENGIKTLFEKMQESQSEIVEATGNEMMAIKQMGEKTFTSIMAVAQQYTDFIKSPSIKENTGFSDFNPADLTDGNKTLYIIIPAEKLKSHYQWLRLVSVSIMRSCVRNPNRRVTFILDEFAALGYMPEMEVALSTYAGYNVSIWPIIQSLSQLKHNYGEGWETFIGNTAVKHFFTIRDNFTADYVSTLFGQTTVVTKEDKKHHSTERRLITPDELMTGGGTYMFTKIDDLPPTTIRKVPYFERPNLEGRYDKSRF